MNSFISTFIEVWIYSPRQY